MMSTSLSLARLPLGGSQGYPGRQNKLYNSIVNVSLVYGIDETTCRGLDMQERGVCSSVCLHSLCFSLSQPIYEYNYIMLIKSSTCTLSIATKVIYIRID